MVLPLLFLLLVSIVTGEMLLYAQKINKASGETMDIRWSNTGGPRRAMSVLAEKKIAKPSP